MQMRMRSTIKGFFTVTYVCEEKDWFMLILPIMLLPYMHV